MNQTNTAIMNFNCKYEKTVKSYKLSLLFFSILSYLYSLSEIKFNQNVIFRMSNGKLNEIR